MTYKRSGSKEKRAKCKKKRNFSTNYKNVQHLNLEIAVWDYDRLGPSEIIGSVVIGGGKDDGQAHRVISNKSMPSSSSTHWQQMLDNPRRPVVYWHPLKVIKVCFVNIVHSVQGVLLLSSILSLLCF